MGLGRVRYSRNCMEAVLHWERAIVDGDIDFVFGAFASFGWCGGDAGLLSVLHALSCKDCEVIDMLVGGSGEAKSVIGDEP